MSTQNSLPDEFTRLSEGQEVLGASLENVATLAADPRLDPASSFADVAGATIEMIAVDRIVPSPFNRKITDENAIQEMADSITRQGLITPIMVRPLNKANGQPGAIIMEMVAGERRWLAHKLLQRAKIAAIVKELTDEQAQEVQIVENLQREGVSPLDECAAYQRLLALNTDASPAGECRICGCVEDRACMLGSGQTCSWTDLSKTLCSNPKCQLAAQKSRVAQIAARVGKRKSVTYVYQRLQLAKLVPEAAAALREGKITPSHAIDCARLEPNDQKGYLAECIERRNGHGTAAGVRQMREWIDREVRRDLKDAPFALDDADLCPGVCACLDCPKMSNSNPELMGDLFGGDAPMGEGKKKKKGVRQICFDPACYQNKVLSFVNMEAMDYAAKAGEPADNVVKLWGGDEWERPRDGAESKYLVEREYRVAFPGDCEYVLPAIIAGGKGIGRCLNVCTLVTCKTHRPGGMAGQSRGMGLSDSEKKARKAHELEKRVRAEAVRQIIQATATLHKPAPIEDLQVMAIAMFARLENDVQRPLAKLLEWAKTTDTRSGYSGYESYEATARVMLPTYSRGKLLQFMLCCALARDLYIFGSQSNLKETNCLDGVGKRYGVDLEAIRADLAKGDKAKSKSATTKSKGADLTEWRASIDKRTAADEAKKAKRSLSPEWRKGLGKIMKERYAARRKAKA